MSTSDLDRLARVVAERASALALYARQWLDAASAEDVVQEALSALLSQRRAPDDPIAWMYRAVRNAAIDQARSSSRRRRREQTVAATRGDWFVSHPDSLIDAQIAEQALRRLPDDDRQIVVLRIWGELGFAQIADIVQMSVTTVHKRYGTALRQLRSALEKPCKSKTD
jgi:RNA polymerase sigma-70 factor (ECF subfamily)